MRGVSQKSRTHTFRRAALALAFCVLTGAAALPYGPAAGSAAAVRPSAPRPKAAAETTAPHAARAGREAYGKIEMSFEENRGQTDGRVRYLARGGGYTLFLTPSEAVFVLARGHAAPSVGDTLLAKGGAASPANAAPPAVLRMRLEGSNASPEVSGVDELEGRVNYFKGSDPSGWHTGVLTYGRVRYENVYEGVGLVYYGNQQQLEYDFVVAPGADHSQVSLSFEGADGIEVEAATGDLLLRVGGGTLRQRKPVVYQEADGARSEVESSYELRGGASVGFRVGAYDRARPLVIDPVLIYSTYLGGSSFDSGRAIAADSAGNAYVTGSTTSTNFPVAGAVQPASGGASDAFVTKINAAGTARVYSTYLGGDTNDLGWGVAVDSAGAAYVTGQTDSRNFPTHNAFQPSMSGSADAFVTKLAPSGAALTYSTYLGGTGSNEGGNAVALDSTGSAYVAGKTDSTNFPTANAVQAVPGGGTTDAFVTKLNPSGATLSYSTYLGGLSGGPIGFVQEGGYAIAVDPAGRASVVGVTDATNFPVANALQPTYGGGYDAFATKLSASGSAFVYSTYLGGTSFDSALGVAVDSAGATYFTGETGSADFPSVNPVQPALSGSTDVFVTKLNPSGSSLVYSTFLGGSSTGINIFEVGNAIAVDSAGSATVVGYTFSNNFPVVNPVQGTFGGSQDAFVAKFHPSGSSLLYSTYLGGSSSDTGNGIAVDPAGNAYVTGDTTSPNFPTVNPIQPTPAGMSSMAFVAKIGNYVIAGRVVDTSNDPIAGVTVTLSGANSGLATTDSNGAFAFNNTTAGGTYTVTPFRAGYTFNPQSIQLPFLNGDQSLLFIGAAPTATPTPTPTPTPDQTFNISGQVRDAGTGAGLPGVTVNLSGARTGTRTTDALGRYSFDELPAGGDYTLFPSRAGYTFNPPAHSVDDLGSDVFADFVATAAPTPTPTPSPTPSPTPATFQFSAASFSANEGAGAVEVIVTRAGDASQPVTVEYATTDGTADDRGDYTTAIGRLRFGAGEAARHFTIFVTDDAYAEGNETVNLTLSNPSAGAQVGDRGSVVLTIVDNDPADGPANPIDSTGFFVRQHYVDFLGREPDASGLAFWTQGIDSCGADLGCRESKRIDTSAAFFLSIEFQQTGFLVERLYREAFNRLPRYREFIRDSHEIGRNVVVGQAGWEAQLAANKQDFVEEFAARAEFAAIYGGLSNEQYVDALNANTGGSLSAAERNSLVAGLNGGTETRPGALLKVADNPAFQARETGPAFVLMQYFGYLRRNPDDPPDQDFSGYDFWLAKLNSFGGDYRRAEMVRAFLSATEYRRRFGRP